MVPIVLCPRCGEEAAPHSPSAGGTWGDVTWDGWYVCDACNYVFREHSICEKIEEALGMVSPVDHTSGSGIATGSPVQAPSPPTWGPVSGAQIKGGTPFLGTLFDALRKKGKKP